MNKQIKFYGFVIIFLILISSCGPYQGVSYYSTDGIYNNDFQVNKNLEESKLLKKNTDTYYQNYFENLSDEYEVISESNQIDSDNDESNSNIYIINNTPNWGFRFGYNPFFYSYRNFWGYNDMFYPWYDNFYSPFWSPFWNYGVQGLYYNPWGFGYANWNYFNNPYNSFFNFNNRRFARKTPYNRGQMNNGRIASLRQGSSKFNYSNLQSSKGTRFNNGRKTIINTDNKRSIIKRILGNNSSNRNSSGKLNYNRRSSNYNQSGSRSSIRSGASRSSNNSGRSSGGRKNNY